MPWRFIGNAEVNPSYAGPPYAVIIRQILTLAAGFLVSHGYMTAGDTQVFVGVGLAVVSTAFGIASRQRAHNELFNALKECHESRKELEHCIFVLSGASRKVADASKTLADVSETAAVVSKCTTDKHSSTSPHE